MSVTERMVVHSVTVVEEHKSIQVLWNNIIERDGAEIARTNHRRAYMESEKEQFLADVPGGEKYAEAAGWK